MKIPALIFLSLVLLAAAPAQAQAPPDIYFNNFEFPDMRIYPPSYPNAIPMTVLLPGEQANPPANGGVCHGVVGSGVCTGFNQTGDSGHVFIVNEPQNCRNGSQWCMRASYNAGEFGSSALLHSGYWQNAQGNGVPQGCSTEGAGSPADYTSGSPGNCFTRNQFYRYFIKWQTNFTMQRAPVGGCQGKLLYVQAGNSP